MVTGIALTTYLGIAVWRVSDDEQSGITDRIYLLELRQAAHEIAAP
jgi:hypothetical protein